MSQTAIVNPRLTANNQTVSIVPNSLTYTEGKGEQQIRIQSSGGGAVETVYVNNVEGFKSILKFSLENTGENIQLALSWKNNANNNVFDITSATGNFSRSVLEAAVTNDYEVGLGSDTKIQIEVMGRQAA